MAKCADLPDRRGDLFGRAPDVDYLVARVASKGLTAVAARPKMGKTWLLQEVGRALSFDKRCLVLLCQLVDFGVGD